MNAFLAVYYLMAFMPSVLAVTWRARRSYSSPHRYHLRGLGTAKCRRARSRAIVAASDGGFSRPSGCYQVSRVGHLREFRPISTYGAQ